MIVLFITKPKGVKPTPKKVVSLKDKTAIVNIPNNLEIRGLIRESLFQLQCVLITYTNNLIK